MARIRFAPDFDPDCGDTAHSAAHEGLPTDF